MGEYKLIIGGFLNRHNACFRILFKETKGWEFRIMHCNDLRNINIDAARMWF